MEAESHLVSEPELMVSDGGDPGFTVRDLHPAFGSEISGLDLGAGLDTATVEALRAVFDERGLLAIRQADLPLAVQRELAFGLIGVPAPDPDAMADRQKTPFYVSNKEPDGGAPFGRLLFHSDGMWLAEPFQLLSLYAVTVEPPVTPTCFVSTVNAWSTLPEELRARVEGLHVEHGHDATYARGGDDGEVLVATFEKEEHAITPIGHRHPRTGRTMLFASQMMTKRVVELDEAASEALLEELFAHLYAPENTLEFAWNEGDLVLWDNLALQHARPNVEVEGPARTLRKVFAPLPVITADTQRPNQRTRAS
jgi:alpha-ketoglutarate-dependent taurine dioxygenase